METDRPARAVALGLLTAAGAAAGLLLFLRFPDADIAVLGIGAHRNFLFHSAAVPVLLAAAAGRAARKASRLPAAALRGLAVGCGAAVAFHLAADAFQSKDVRFPFVGSLVDGTSLDDRLWLAGNALGSLAAAAFSGLRGTRPRR